MTSTTFGREPQWQVGFVRTDVAHDNTRPERPDCPGRAKPDSEGRGGLLILAFCLLALAWIVLLRDVRAGLPGSMAEAPRQVAGRLLENERQGGALGPSDIPPGREARGAPFLSK
jgi:hypothetical protein